MRVDIGSAAGVREAAQTDQFEQDFKHRSTFQWRPLMEGISAKMGNGATYPFG
jgi:hypothetical protein